MTTDANAKLYADLNWHTFETMREAAIAAFAAGRSAGFAECREAAATAALRLVSHLDPGCHGTGQQHGVQSRLHDFR